MDLYQIFLEHPIVTTDSRNCPDGSIFFALKGDKFNANKFAHEALEKGCSYAVIDEAEYATDSRFIVVRDVLKALQDLANQHRKNVGVKIIGITGTNGKTTTKELIASVLQEKYKVHFTKGNLNNHIGVPLTLLQLTSEHQLAIIEMGANHPGEIKTLCEIAEPDFGIITNVGKAHLEGFGSFEGVKQTKAELYDYISANGKGIFINNDNESLKEMAKSAKIHEDKQVAYSLKANDDLTMVTGMISSSDPFLNMQCQTGTIFDINTHLVGAYNAENILAAVTIGHFFGLKNTQIKHGIETYKPLNNRSQFIDSGKNKLIVDAYNANPTSMLAAINNFAEMQSNNKMLILGDMFELGNQSEIEHQNIVNVLEEKKFHNVLLIGTAFMNTNNNFKTFNDVDDLTTYISNNCPANNIILIKGSRSVQLEKIISLL
ncbi:MAG: UDP-N-acetylmuramoyl-tripeptide--D-alanyl-D-alanine ligase [Bacteroidales bacterium 36-12]|nr:MAG: UDP-N-acetylmuramoyl-tripeptide--D-alanyl-D-alanine ligase [Bacteroidales bacterium 36-12]